MNYPYPYFPQQTMQPTPLRNNDFTLVMVKHEQEVFNYPVGCGHSVNFKLENGPYLYTKTMGFSQFDKPIIEKYRLLKEDLDSSTSVDKPVDKPDWTSKFDIMQGSINELETRLSNIQNDVNSLKDKRGKKDESNGSSKGF